MKHVYRPLLRSLIALVLCVGMSGTGARQAPEVPGIGVIVRPAQSQLDEETFQTRLVARALASLGYAIEPTMRTPYAEAHRAVASGEATFLADHWDPLHAPFFAAAGGVTRLSMGGTLTDQAVQGYLIDRKSAEAQGIRGLGQLREARLARLFDTDGDGKADLAGCNPGWGCRQIIDHQLAAFDLTDTVTHHHGPYETLIEQVIERHRGGQPVLYYAWTPYWVSSVLVPGRDVIWLTVPFSSRPGDTDRSRTALPDGTDYGFALNTIRILVNRRFAEAHPDAMTLFRLMRLPARDISAQNLRMHHGESSDADIERHVSEWIARHRVTWEGWLQQARAAAP